MLDATSDRPLASEELAIAHTPAYDMTGTL
jgi:hypothetical protein